jgi:hypothetical protein
MSEPPPREANTDTDASTDRAPVPVRERADGYFRNGAWVPRDAEPDPMPPGWREWFESRVNLREVDRRIWFGAVGVVVVLVLLLVITHQGSPAQVPKQERDFLTAVRHGQTAVRNGNDITLVTAARKRASEACALLPRGGGVDDWVGTLTKVGTVSGGKQGQVAVKIADGVQLHTWTRGSEDAKDHTLVDPNSDVYQVLADLKSGDEVRFSGSFARKGATCLHETSLFARNGMLTPGFVFRFTAVAPR